MIICQVCKKTFTVHSETDDLLTPLEHHSDNSHFFAFNNRRIKFENIYRLIIEEEIPVEDSGEVEAKKNLPFVSCFLCGAQGKDPVLCGMCNVVVCTDCFNDHDELLAEISKDKKL